MLDACIPDGALSPEAEDKLFARIPRRRDALAGCSGHLHHGGRAA
jgi:hypothetical protein